MKDNDRVTHITRETIEQLRSEDHVAAGHAPGEMSRIERGDEYLSWIISRTVCDAAREGASCSRTCSRGRRYTKLPGPRSCCTCRMSRGGDDVPDRATTPASARSGFSTCRKPWSVPC
jgi:hypothetical protein